MKATFIYYNIKRSILNLLKDINKIQCRLQLDIDEKSVTVLNINNVSMIDAVIDIIDQYFSIKSVDIDNTEMVMPLTVAPISEEVNSMVPMTHLENTEGSEDTSKIETETVNEESEPSVQSDIVESESSDNQKGIFLDLLDYLEEACDLALSNNVPEQQIRKAIYSLIDEITMNSSNKKTLAVNPADVVDCNFGTHLPGEVNGNHVHCVICNVQNDMVCVIPLCKNSNFYSKTHTHSVELKPKFDIIYNGNFDFNGGIALLDRCRYVRVERVNSIIGKVTPGTFQKILTKLPESFTFY